jgi:hypothetical protein
MTCFLPVSSAIPLPVMPSGRVDWYPLLTGGFFILFFMYFIQHYFICRPSDFTVAENAGIEPRAVATLAWRSDPLTTQLDLIHTRLDIINTRLDLIHSRLDLIHYHKRSLMDSLFLSLTNVFFLLVCGFFPEWDFFFSELFYTYSVNFPE